MYINSRDLFVALRDKGINNLFHANSLETSCTFLEQGALLSRGLVEKHGLRQSPQKSDDLDQRFGIWFDTFLDFVDLHRTLKRRNLYGPILFVLTSRLLCKDFPVRVTKKNPVRWRNNDQPSDRFYASVAEFRLEYKPGTPKSYGSMLLIPFHEASVPLHLNLEKILIDDPQIVWLPQKRSLFDHAADALCKAAEHSVPEGISIHRRLCASYCSCSEEYLYTYKHFWI